MNDVLELLLKLDTELKPNLEEGQLCDKAVRAVVRTLDGDSGSVLLRNDDSLVLTASVGQEAMLRGQRYGLCEGPSGVVFSSRQPMRIDGVTATAGAATQRQPESALLAPLLVADRAIGVLCLNSFRPQRRFGDDDLHLFTLAANRIAGAVDSARRMRRERDGFLRTVRALVSAVEAKDPYTAGHCERVAKYSVLIAAAIGRSESEVEELRLAALLHDVGKIGVPESILLFPGRLSEQQFETVQSHTRLGHSICQTAGLSDVLCDAVLHHHERYDGQGYPQRLAGRAIPLEARIIAVADAYDAMTSSRAYRPALPVKNAIAELVRVSGSQLDPSLAGALITVLSRSPGMSERPMAKLPLAGGAAVAGAA